MIRTKCLELRHFEHTDRPVILSLLKGDDFMSFSPTGAMSNEQAEFRFEQLLNGFLSNGIGKFAVVELASGNLIGYCGLEEFEYENERVFELGYRLDLSSRGNGYAFEASLAVLEFAKEVGLDTVLALTEPENALSKHILDKLGFELCGNGAYQRMPVQYFKKYL